MSVTVAFFLVPLGAVLALGLGPGFAARLLDLAQTPYTRNRLVFTFTQAFASTLLTLALGLPAAYLFARRRFPLRRFLRAALTVPFVMPPLVVAIALNGLWGPRGLATPPSSHGLLAWIGPSGAILLAHVVYNVSLVIRIVGNHLQRVPNSLLEAAATLGANRRQRVTRVLLRSALPSIASASLLVLLFTLTSFGVIVLLGGARLGTLETLVYETAATFNPDYPLAATLGLLQAAATGLVLFLYVASDRRVHAQQSPALDTPAAHLGPFGGTYLAALATLVCAPFLALGLQAFRYDAHPSLEAFRLTFGSGPSLGSYTVAQAATNSILFAIGTVVIAVPLALLTVYGLRRAPIGSRLLQPLLLLPLGTSSVLLGLGYLITFDGDPLWDLRAHPARILLAHLLIALPFVTRILHPALDAIPPRVHEAAATLGANPRARLARVELPLLRPALLAAATYAFAISLGEFGATLLLRRPRLTTLPLALFDAFGHPGAAFQAQATVIAFLLAAAALTAFWALEHARGPQGDWL